MANGATVAAPLARPLLSRRARERLTGYVYLLPVGVVLGGTVLFPILKAMHMSLYNHVLIKPQEYRYVGLANYLRLLPVPGRLRGGAPASRVVPGPRPRPYHHAAAVDHPRGGGRADLGIHLPAQLRAAQRHPEPGGVDDRAGRLALEPRARDARRRLHE